MGMPEIEARCLEHVMGEGVVSWECLNSWQHLELYMSQHYGDKYN
jgi:hypothetical protein